MLEAISPSLEDRKKKMIRRNNEIGRHTAQLHGEHVFSLQLLTGVPRMKTLSSRATVFLWYLTNGPAKYWHSKLKHICDAIIWSQACCRRKTLPKRLLAYRRNCPEKKHFLGGIFTHNAASRVDRRRHAGCVQKRQQGTDYRDCTVWKKIGFNFYVSFRTKRKNTGGVSEWKPIILTRLPRPAPLLRKLSAAMIGAKTLVWLVEKKMQIPDCW